VSTIKVGVIGLGRWGPNHVRNFSALQNSEVVAGADSSQEAVSRMRSIYGQADFDSDYKRLLERPDVQAVVVSTPTSTHYSIVKDALIAGKHVLCEKPLALRSDEAWELVSMARDRELHLMVGHVFLFNSGIQYLAETIGRDPADPVFYLSATRTNLGPFRKDVNAAWDLASHDIYIFNHLLNQRPVGVAATGASYLQSSVEDIMFLSLVYPGNVMGHIHVSWLDPKKVRQITVVSEKKMITWDEAGVPGPITIYDRSVIRDPVYHNFGEFQLLAREGDVVMPRVQHQEPLAVQARAFLDLIGGQSLQRRGSGPQAAEVVDVLVAADRSLKEGGRMQEIAYGC
jgi:predicted dehydrogenase